MNISTLTSILTAVVGVYIKRSVCLNADLVVRVAREYNIIRC